MNLQSILKEYFGYEQFRPLQKEIISYVLSQKDALVLMPTGAGKSLCYQIPALALDGVTLVISPLIALMKDQVDALRANGISAGFLNSTLTGYEMAKMIDNVRVGEIKILYVAPERFGVSGFHEFLKSIKLNLIAVDEAHCISEWGHDFRPDYRNLNTLRQSFPRVPIIALTATATPRVRDDIITQLNLASPQIFTSSFNRANLTYGVYPKDNTFEFLLQILKRHKDKSVIIYCFSRANTEKLSQKLRGVGIKAAAYHAGLNPDVRRAAQEDFIKDRIPVVVATIAFGMGIDKPDVRAVIHYDLPKSVEGYYQETGRAGRDGLPSECVLFYSYGDTAKHYRFMKDITDAQDKKHAEEKLKQMVSYAELSSCRRHFLLGYFNEQFDAPCNTCDNCLQKTEKLDATEITQKILSAVVRTGQRYGGGYIADVLTGKNDEKVMLRKHNNLSVFGIAADMKKKHVIRIINALCGQGLLTQQGGEYPVYVLTSRGKQFLTNKETLALSKHVMSRPKESEQRVGLDDSTPTDFYLFEKLRVLRSKLAEERNVPPYIIFGDRTLKEMSQRVPKDVSELSQIFGVGSQKLEWFGDAFLEVIRGYVNEGKSASKS